MYSFYCKFQDLHLKAKAIRMSKYFECPGAFVRFFMQHRCFRLVYRNNSERRFSLSGLPGQVGDMVTRIMQNQIEEVILVSFDNTERGLSGQVGDMATRIMQNQIEEVILVSFDNTEYVDRVNIARLPLSLTQLYVMNVACSERESRDIRNLKILRPR